MRRNPKPSGIGTDFWSGTYMVDFVAENGSVRTMLSDGQTIPVNHRDLKEFIPKLRPDPEFPKQNLEGEKKKQETELSGEMK
jgi:hypothetical protein